MKKVLVVMLSVAFVMAFAVGTVCAKKAWNGPFRDAEGNKIKDVFETGVAIVVDTVPTCTKGEVFIREDGTLKVEIEDAAILADTDYTVQVFCGGVQVGGDFTVPAKLEDGELIFFVSAALPDFTCTEGVTVEITGDDGFEAVSAVCVE